MNLINRDDIHIVIEYPQKCDKSQFTEAVLKAVKMIIENAPTVEAIPVEWLKKKYPLHGVAGTEMYFRKAHAVEDILKDWELEKEKRKEE